MENKVRVRFAPSPTGYLHVGGLRTALFNYLYARKHNGVFVLRIEDTDKTRSTDESIDQILDSMRWLGLEWDEGPYRQTERENIYIEQVNKLLENGKAYKCFCTPEELEKRRKDAYSKGNKPKYDGRCRELKDIPTDKPYVVRFHIPEEGKTTFKDLIYGKISVENSELDDLIIQRSDGSPTYNLCVVIDDAQMEISHVIRGDDHLANTPRQIHIYKALGYEIPQFAHLSMILGSDKSRLSKRHGASSVLEYKELGYLPEALINYIVRLGWSHGDQEIFSMDELKKYFSFEHVNKSAAVFNPEKLLWLNAQYIKKTDPAKLSALVCPFLVTENVIPVTDDSIEEKVVVGIPSLVERSKTLIELAKGTSFYMAPEIVYEQKTAEKFLKIGVLPLLEQLNELIKKSNNLDEETVHLFFNKVCERNGVKLGKLAQPVRVALTGTKVSPGIFEIIEIIGKERTVKRLEEACRWIAERDE